MTRLSFLSPVSPPLRILEVRGGVPTGSIPIGPDRALVVGDTAADLGGYRVYDMSAALVAVEVESDALLQRVTELTEFPAVGSVLRGVPAWLLRYADQDIRRGAELLELDLAKAKAAQG